MKNVKPTIWLDFMTYVIIPFYLITNVITLVNMFKDVNYFDLILLLLIMIYSLVTFLFLSKRKNISCYLLLGYIVLLGAIFNYIFYTKVTNGIYLAISIMGTILCWILPNYIYLFKRQDFFKEHSNRHIKKCPGCNRIIPIAMACCGRCGYKEGNNG